MPEQLIFELAEPPPARFSTFVAGRNAEAVDHLARIASGLARETGVVLWGAGGAGKTHLLLASVEAARESARDARYVASPDDVGEHDPVANALVAVDDVHRASDAAQARLFTLYNALAACGGQLVVASEVPPARMTLRDDVRTRLSWGLVFEIVPLADDEKAAALATFARARGFDLSGEAIDYLLAHGRRDMRSLVHALTSLDRHSLALRRPITVPLIREWLQRQMPLDG